MAEKQRSGSGVNLAEVARAAGVSRMTVSRVLRNASGFSDETRARVLAAAERLSYVPNRIAAAFGTVNATTLVGVSVPRLTSSLFGEALESIDRTLSRLGYQTMIGLNEQSPQAEETWLRTLLSWRPAGVILTGRSHTAAALELLRAAAVPVVEIWDLNTSPIDISVGFNHFDCGYEMGCYVIGRGRRRIGYVGASAGASRMSAARHDGFAKALADAGLGFAEVEVLNDRPCFYAGFYGCENVLSRASDLDALYFQDDAMAIGGLHFCQSRQLSVPDDIGIAGWGGMEAASVLPLRLTTTRISTTAVGKLAAEALVARLRGEPVEDVIVVQARLVPGQTM